MSHTNRRLPTQEEIKLRAYEIYLKRGSVSGGELDDWLAAEKELSESFQKAADKPTVREVKPLRKSAAAS